MGVVARQPAAILAWSKLAHVANWIMAESPICVDLHDCININSTMVLVGREVLGYEKPKRNKAILNPKASQSHKCLGSRLVMEHSLMKARVLVACEPHPLYKDNFRLSIILLTISLSKKTSSDCYHNVPSTGQNINTGPRTMQGPGTQEPRVLRAVLHIKIQL